MKAERVIIVGGPRRGKSTLATLLNANSPGGMHIRCGDPKSKVKDPLPHVEYLPEGIPISGDDGAAQWVADHWFTLPGPWVCEGWVMARALRRWLASNPPRVLGQLRGHVGITTDQAMPADRIIVLDRPGFGQPTKEQNAMHKGVMTTWYGDGKKIPPIAPHFVAITEYR